MLLIRDEIAYLMACCDTNHDGKIDYIEFTERYHNPAEDIGKLILGIPIAVKFIVKTIRL